MNSRPFPNAHRPFSCPESILFIHPEASRLEVDVDMLFAVVDRTTAMIEMLSGYYQTPSEHLPGNISDAMLNDYIWQLAGNMQIIRQILETAPLRDKAPKPAS